MYFLNEPLEEVKSLKLLGFTINPNLSLALILKRHSRSKLNLLVGSEHGRGIIDNEVKTNFYEAAIPRTRITGI